MNETNSTVTCTHSLYDQLVEKSLATLDRTLLASVGLLCTGSLAFVTNILVVLIILKYNELKTPSHFLICQLAIADWLVGASYMATGIKRLIRILWRIPEVNSQVACSAEMFLAYFSQAASLTLALAISIERVVATVVPVHYRNNSRKLVTCLTGIGWIYAIIDSSFMFHGISTGKLIPNCNLVSSVSSGFYRFQSVHKLVQVCLMMVMYCVVMLSVRYQVEKAKKRNQSIHAIKKQIQVKIARMLGVVGLMYLVTQIITRIGLAVLGRLPAAVRANYAPFIRMLMIVNSGINFFIYVRLSSDYKNGFRVLLGKPVIDPNTQVPLNTSKWNSKTGRKANSVATLSRANSVAPFNAWTDRAYSAAM